MFDKYQSLVEAYLKASSLTPGIYTPSAAVKSADLVAVFVGTQAVLLTGASSDAGSVLQAESFCQLNAFVAAMQVLKLDGPIEYKKINGSDLEWPDVCEAVVASTSGAVEDSAGEGDLMMINLTAYKELTVLLCINTELARIIDPKAPMMDDGILTAQFGSDNVQVLQLH
tara:strand:+ start:675 stop:1184 length:510 start_codon:yes stop_codon:yes gene_type:complete